MEIWWIAGMENLSLNKGDLPWLSNIVNLATGILDLTRAQEGHPCRPSMVGEQLMHDAHDRERQTPVPMLVLIKEDDY